MISSVNYVISRSCSAGATPGIPLPELNTGGKYCCSYYSKQGDRWQFKKAN